MDSSMVAQDAIKPKPHFFDLPQEVRDMIYAYFPYLAYIHINQDPTKVAQPNISKICRRMRRECLDVFYGRNKFFLDIRGWKDASYPREWTPSIIFQRWITAIGDENAARLRSLSFFSHNHFSVNVKISKEAPLALALRFRTDATKAEVAEGAPPGYNSDIAAERAEKAFRHVLDDIEEKNHVGPITVDDIMTICNTVDTIQPFLCRRMNLGFQGALLLKDDPDMSRWPDTEAHLDKCDDCGYHRFTRNSDERRIGT